MLHVDDVRNLGIQCQPICNSPTPPRKFCFYTRPKGEMRLSLVRQRCPPNGVNGLAIGSVEEHEDIKRVHEKGRTLKGTVALQCGVLPDAALCVLLWLLLLPLLPPLVLSLWPCLDPLCG